MTAIPLSVGEPSVRLLKLELKWYGFGDGGTVVVSSTGKHVSTIASKQFTNNSDDSPIKLYWKTKMSASVGDMQSNFWNRTLTLGLVNGPAKRQSPPKPQLCKKCNCCWDGSSVANIFWMILWMAIRTAWSFDIESTLLIFWSSNEWLNFVVIKLGLVQSVLRYPLLLQKRLTWLEKLAEIRPNLRPDIDIILAFHFRLWCT